MSSGICKLNAVWQLKFSYVSHQTWNWNLDFLAEEKKNQKVMHVGCCACTFFKNTKKPSNNGLLETNGWLRKTFFWRTEWKVKCCWFSVWKEGNLISFKGTYHMTAQMFVKMLVSPNWKLYKCYHFIMLSSLGAFGCFV